MEHTWEYKDFVWKNTSGDKWVLGMQVNRHTVRQESWSKHRSSILSELQKWRESGWEPFTTLGPDCWELRELTCSPKSGPIGMLESRRF